MGAAQSTTIDVRNIIDNVISAKVRSEMREQQRAEVSQTIDISGGRGFFTSISQDAGLNITSESIQSAMANFKFTQEMVNKVQSEVTQAAQALTLSINKQDIEQSINNRLSNRTLIENSVKQTCESSNLIKQSIRASRRVDFILKIRQGVVGDVVRRCNNQNTTIAEVVQGIENDLDISSANTVVGLPFWLIAVIIVAGVVLLLGLGRGFTGVFEKNPTMGMGLAVLLVWVIYAVPVGMRLSGTIGKGKGTRDEKIAMAVGGVGGLVATLLLVLIVGRANRRP